MHGLPAFEGNFDLSFFVSPHGRGGRVRDVAFHCQTFEECVLGARLRQRARCVPFAQIDATLPRSHQNLRQRSNIHGRGGATPHVRKHGTVPEFGDRLTLNFEKEGAHASLIVKTCEIPVEIRNRCVWLGKKKRANTLLP